MIKHALLLSLISSCCSLHTLAQAPPNRSESSNNTTIQRSQEQKKSTDGNEIPLIDPTNRQIIVNGKIYGVAKINPDGQFEAYLKTDIPAASTKYRTHIRQILDYLAPDKTGGVKLKPAYDLLSIAAKYPGDGKLCESIANTVYTAQTTKHELRIKRDFINKLMKEQKRLNKAQLREKKNLVVKERVIEIELLLKKLEANGLINVTQSKLQFQAMMVQLYEQRRFEHCVMATRFYSTIFKGGGDSLKLKKGADAGDFFAENVGVNPTVDGIAAASAGAIKKVDTLVNAFHKNIKTKRIHAASGRLAEAFAVGEFLPSVQTVDIKFKAPIQQYIKDANNLLKVLHAKDLARGELLIKSLQKQAIDYDTSGATSYIAGKKSESKIYIRDAKMVLFKFHKTDRHNDVKRFKKAMLMAKSAWPSNPEIAAINDLIDNLLNNKLDQVNDADDM